jgi:hypothetical protein
MMVMEQRDIEDVITALLKYPAALRVLLGEIEPPDEIARHEAVTGVAGGWPRIVKAMQEWVKENPTALARFSRLLRLGKVRYEPGRRFTNRKNSRKIPYFAQNFDAPG